MKNGVLSSIRFWALMLLLCPMLTACIGEHSDSDTGRVHVGDLAPDFTVAMTDGSSVTLSDMRGKVVLLTFFASWCPTCQRELAAAQQDVIDRFAGTDFCFLPVSRRETPAEIAAFRERSGITFAVGLDPQAAAYGLYATLTVPRNYLIDADGYVVAEVADYTIESFDALLREIEKRVR